MAERTPAAKLSTTSSQQHVHEKLANWTDWRPETKRFVYDTKELIISKIATMMIKLAVGSTSLYNCDELVRDSR